MHMPFRRSSHALLGKLAAEAAQVAAQASSTSMNSTTFQGRNRVMSDSSVSPWIPDVVMLFINCAFDVVLSFAMRYEIAAWIN